MTGEHRLLHIYEEGAVSVIGFAGRDVLDDVNVAICRDEMLALVDRTHCTKLAVDLTGVKLVPSGLLGLLASIRRRGVDVHLYNPSHDVREVLSVTNLDRLMPVHDVAFDHSAH